MTCNTERGEDFLVLGGSEEQDISLTQPSDIKLPPLPMTALLNESKTCPKCEHLLKNGLHAARIDIHSTLAYSRCKCHRDWKYENLSRLQQTEDETVGLSSHQKMIAGIVPSSRSVASRNHSALSSKRRNPFHKAALLKPRVLCRNLSSLKLKGTTNSVIADESAASSKAATCVTRSYVLEEGRSFRAKDILCPLVIADVNKSVETPKNTSLSSVSGKKLTSNGLGSTPKLPQILSSSSRSVLFGCSSPAKTECRNSSSWSKAGTNKHSLKVLTQPMRSKSQPKQFEFVQLLKYLSSYLKQEAKKVFMEIDQDGDGHLSYAEVAGGLGRNFDEVSRDVLKMFLKPIYHTLGDATYFGKREFTLCYSMILLLHEHKLPKLYQSQSVEFYIKTVKPLMALMHLSANEKGTIPIFVIEALVEDHCQKSGSRIIFRKFKVTNLIEEDGLMSLINIFILAPYLFETM